MASSAWQSLVMRHLRLHTSWRVARIAFPVLAWSEDGHCEERGCAMLDAAADMKPAAKGDLLAGMRMLKARDLDLLN